MRSVRVGVAILLLWIPPGSAAAQSFVVHGSAGPTFVDAGVSAAAGAGFSPNSHVTLLASVEQTHLFSRSRSDGRGGSSAFRGGRVTFGTAEIRAALRGRDRVSPFVLGGVGLGISKPNVNDTFPDPVTNTVRVLFAGGGIYVPLREHLHLVVDARMVVGAEAGELLAMAPLRAGLTWHF